MKSSIFETYTGSAFLNNACQTIEVLANLNDVSEITSETLLSLYQKHQLWDLYKRMKSYSMLFTRNGPLLNDKEYGQKIYKGLLEYIPKNFEKEGKYLCEISGLSFNTTFEEVYTKVLKEINYPQKKINGKDKTINRCWFPLIGALGSDAQALPQAKFDITIHPICLVTIQFLPFSALIYKGGILLFDSINFDFSRYFIEESTKRVLDKIELTPMGKSVDNIKDFNKGTYLLKAIQLFAEKKCDYDDAYSDLNLWSFSNSGTGANCEIDRVPNQLFKKLLKLYNNIETQNDLDRILKNQKISGFFLEHLEVNKDFWGLYPRTKTDGVGIDFFEAYQNLIGNNNMIEYARYIASLIKKDEKLKKAEKKLLDKWDAYTSPDYPVLIYSVLVRAAEAEEWSLKDHLSILDQPDELPIRSSFFSIFKMIHFYYQNSARSTSIPSPIAIKLNCQAAKVISLVIRLIKEYEDARQINIHEKLTNPQEFKTYSLRPVLIFAANRFSLEEVSEFYFQDFRQQRLGLNSLLRIYYSNPVEWEASEELELQKKVDLGKYIEFAKLYTEYYFNKYQNPITKEPPLHKFKKHVLGNFPKYSGRFINWLVEAKSNMLNLIEEEPLEKFTTLETAEIENLFNDILFDGYGLENPAFARFAIEFSLHKIFSFTFKNVEI